MVNAPLTAEPGLESHELLQELGAGNKRYLAENFTKCRPDRKLVEQLKDGQKPHAVILGCSDSRCPPELMFDQGLGDLFIVRVAGNVTSPQVLGSILYAVANLGSRLVVVLGHTSCGAVKATVDHVCSANPAPLQADDPVPSLLSRIAPVVKQASEGRDGDIDTAFLTEVGKRNAAQSAEQVRDMLKAKLPSEVASEVAVVSAIYNLDSGVVDFLGLSKLA